MRITNSFVAAAVATFGMVGAAQAAQISSSDSVSLTRTNFMAALSVDRFDSSLGTLNSVTIELTGGVQGNAQGESLDAAPADLTLDLSAMITATTANLAGDLGVVLPVVSNTFAASAADGTIDFGGTSGIAFIDVSGTDSVTNSYMDAATLGEFTGASPITIDIDAMGQSAGSGAGNLITQFSTFAEATLTVTYDYTAAPTVAPVPLPAGMGLLLTGLVGLGAVARRRRG